MNECLCQTEDLPSGREINEVEQRILDQLTGSSQDHDHQVRAIQDHDYKGRSIHDHDHQVRSLQD